MKFPIFLLLACLILCFFTPLVLSDEWDDDDFEDDLDLTNPATAKSPPFVASPEVKRFVVIDKKDFTMEIIGVTFIALYGLAYLLGRIKNINYAHSFIDSCQDLFEKNFSSLGANSAAGNHKGLLKESQALWKYFASGRQNCVAMLVQIKTLSRQDLFSLVYDFFVPDDDNVTIDISLDASTMDTFVFVICPKKQHKSLISSNSDIKDFASLVPNDRLPKEFPSDLCILTDCRDLIPEILTTKFLAVLTKHSKLVSCIHITDQRADLTDESINNNEIAVSPCALRIVFKLPPPENMNDILPLMETAISLIDTATKLSLSKGSKTKALESRRIVKQRRFNAAHNERQSAIQAKRDEDLEKMTPAERRKYQEKEKAKRAKMMSAPKVKVKMV